MQESTLVIASLCGYLGGPEEPLGTWEWTELVGRLEQQGLLLSDLGELAPEDCARLLGFRGAQGARFAQLLRRRDTLPETLERWARQGVGLVTQAEARFPAALRETLGERCPPLLFYAGDLELAGRPAVGYVGSRAITPADALTAQSWVVRTVARGYGVVSGGAVGADQAAQGAALRRGGGVVSYLCDSLARKLTRPEVREAVSEGSLLLLSAAGPDAPFSRTAALTRNRYIYAHAQATVVVRSDMGKGGTWQGATDALRHGWCPVLCWDRPDYPGNAALIARGARPIETDWDGDILRDTALWETPAVREDGQGSFFA